MFLAAVFRIAFGAVVTATPPEEPVKTLIVEPIKNARVADVFEYIDGSAMKRATLDFVAASTTPIGIDVKPVDASLKAQLKLDGGALVARVAPESEAAKAGINVYDVVVRLEGQAVPDPAWLRKNLENPTLGKKAGEGDEALYVATLDLVREAKPFKVELRRVQKPQIALTTKAYINVATANQKPEGEITFTKRDDETAKPTYRIGVSLAEADDVLRSQLKLSDRQGLVVTQVVKDSPAAKAGVAKNDVILTFDNSPATGVEDLTARLQKVGDKPATIVLQRAGEKLSLDVQAMKDDPIQFYTTTKDRGASDVAEVISDFIIMTDQDGKRLAVSAKTADAFATTSPQKAESIFVTSDKAEPSIEAEIKELRHAVDRVQAELARLEKDRVVEKLQSKIARLEAALSKGESPKAKK